MGKDIIMRLLYIAVYATCAISQIEALKIAVNGEQHMTVMEGTQNIALNCPITGATSPVTYRWFHTAKQGQETQITASTASYRLGKSVLTIATVSRTDQGDFRAEVTDAAGGSGTCRFNLNVPYPPTFVNLPPPEIYVNLSQAFTLDCVVDGNPTPTINWLKDGAQLGNRVNIMFVGSQLVFTKIQTFDRGSYQCNATNEYGSVISPSTLIYVDVPLFFTSTPESVMLLNEGDNVTLECNITGYPHPIITWFKDNYQLNNDYHRTITRVYSELYSWSHLTFTTIKYTDSGLYMCQAQNKNQAITYASDVIVQVLPQITTHHPKGMIVHIGDPFTLECKANGIPPPTYTWYHNGRSIRLADTHYQINRQEGALSVKESFGTDAGEYYCHVVNSVGEVNSPTTVLFIEGLHFLKQPPPTVYILEGLSKELECEVAGTKKATRVEWYRNDQKIRPRCTPNVFPPDCPIDVQQNTLVLNQVSVEEQGTYMCIGREIEGRDPRQIRTRTNVHIMVAPDFEPKLPSVIEGRRMGDLTINCTAIGKPPPKMEWLKNGIHMSNDTYRVVQDGLLHISELRTRHNGKYTCIATNGAGTASQVIRIHVNSGPAALNATVTVSSWSATVAWQVRQTNGYEIQHFEMEYQELKLEMTEWIGIGGNIPGDARQFTLMNLKANTTYQLHMWAVNKQGVGEILTKLFTTSPKSAEASGLSSNHLIILVAVVAVILCLILVLVCIVLTRKNSSFWISSKQEDGHSLMNNQHDTLSSGSHVNPAFNTESGGAQRGMELHEVSTTSTNYGSTVTDAKGAPQQVVDTSA